MFMEAVFSFREGLEPLWAINANMRHFSRLAPLSPHDVPGITDPLPRREEARK